MRPISDSEIGTLMTCQARWDFSYGGHLAGGHALRRKAVSAHLSNGRAWGAAVATWHAFPVGHDLLSEQSSMQAKLSAHEALMASYAQDVAEQAESDVWLAPETHAERVVWLSEVLDHYMASAPKLPNLTRVEDELDVGIPSRTGRHRSTKYRFGGFIDGYTIDAHEHDWIVEYKFREKLTPVPLIELSRQILRYGWAHQQQTGRAVVGAIIEERLADVPKPARLVKARRKSEGINGLTPSHDKDQLTTPENYIALCQEFGVEAKPDVAEALGRRLWQQRVRVLFRPGELEEAGRELVSAAKLIAQMDSGELYPVRNGQPHVCRGCRFREACPNPRDDFYLSTLYDFVEPKRLRKPESEAAAA